MVTLLLAAILLTLIFGTAWLRGVGRFLAAFAALVTVSILTERIGVSFEALVKFGFLVFVILGILGSLIWKILEKKLAEVPTEKGTVKVNPVQPEGWEREIEMSKSKEKP